MNITCIIVTRNPAHCSALVHQLQTYNHHIVMVHPATTQAPAGVTSIQTPSLMSPAYARNIGARASTSELLCFLDDDIVMHGDVPRRLAHAFHAPHIVACGAILHDHSHNDYWQRAFHRMAFASQHQMSAQRIPLILASMAIMVRHTTFQLIGGFDESFTLPAGEDADLSLHLRQYGAIMTIPQAKISHLPYPVGVLGVTVRSWRYGTAWPKVRQRHPRFTHTLTLHPSIITILICVSAPLLALYDTARTRRSGYWFARWWLRMCWYLGVARGFQ